MKIQYYLNKVSYATPLLLACITSHASIFDRINVTETTIENIDELLSELIINFDESNNFKCETKDCTASIVGNAAINSFIPIFANRIREVFHANQIETNSLIITSDKIKQTFANGKPVKYALLMFATSVHTQTGGAGGAGGWVNFTLKISRLSDKKDIWIANMRVWTGTTFNTAYMYDRTTEALKSMLESFQKNKYINVEKLEIPELTNRLPNINQVTFIPGISPAGRELYARFLKQVKPRAFVISPLTTSTNIVQSNTGEASSDDQENYKQKQDEATKSALSYCEESVKKYSTFLHTYKCKVYAIDDRVIWDGISE